MDFPTFPSPGMGNLGIWGFLELDFQEQRHLRGFGLGKSGFGKSKGRVWFWREFLGIIPIFSASFPKFGDFIHEKTWIGIPGIIPS